MPANAAPNQTPVFPSPIRTILASLSGRSGDSVVLQHAAELARTFGAHVGCVHVPSEPPPIAELAGKDAASAWRGFKPPRDEARDERAAAARRAFNMWRTEHGWPVSGDAALASVTVGYSDIDGDEATILTERARVADLAVLVRPDGLAALFVFDSLLAGSGRPMLMVPTAAAPTGQGAVVAWNGSLQSARALGAAVPLLRAFGGEVAILCVAERNRKATATDAVGYLHWHGIEATIAPPTTENVGVQLLALARARQAGLIVSGAYSHSRLRQLLFGGVTAHLVERADVPVLFAG
ncbi:MAG: universal stress protein [Bauldia sp.]|nr:universal stress protein [Bauldia sp.]MCW5717631.1 universal stress protein [Bauldia sp.]